MHNLISIIKYTPFEVLCWSLNNHLIWTYDAHNIRCPTHKKGPYANCRQHRSRSACASVQSDLGILCSSTYTTVSTDSVSKQWWPKSACIFALSANYKRALFMHSTSYVFYGDLEKIIPELSPNISLIQFFWYSLFQHCLIKNGHLVIPFRVSVIGAI